MKRAYRSVITVCCAFKFRKKISRKHFPVNWLRLSVSFLLFTSLGWCVNIRLECTFMWLGDKVLEALQNFRCLLQILVDATALESGVGGSVWAVIFPCNQKVSSRTVRWFLTWKMLPSYVSLSSMLLSTHVTWHMSHCIRDLCSGYRLVRRLLQNNALKS